MGLDQFLYRSRINNLGEHEYEQIYYWRKENQINHFFETRIDGGVINCEMHEVTKQDLIDLVDLCKYVIKHPEEGPNVLPTMEGFIFGSTDYGDWYLESCASTIENLEKIIENDYNDEYYYSVWY